MGCHTRNPAGVESVNETVDQEVAAMTEQTDIVVVGGGVAGLSVAGLAAGGGARTVLFDSHPLGGRGRATHRDGFTFNQGAHALYLGGAGERVLGQLGVTIAGGAPATDQTYGRVGDAIERFPVGPATLARTRLLGTRSRVAFARLFASLRTMRTADLHDRSLTDWLDERRVPDDLRALVLTLARTATYSHAPDRVSADAALAQMKQAVSGGVRYLDGGWQRMVDGLAQVAARRGAVVRPGAGIRSVQRRGAVWVVETADHAVESRAVVLACGGPALMSSLVEDAIGRRHWEADAGPPVTASALDLGVSAPTRYPVVLGVDRPLYLSTHTPPADLAPDGHGVICLLRYHGPGEQPDADDTRRHLWEHAHLAGVQDGSVVTDRYLHRMTVSHGLPTPERGGLAGRPPVEVEDAPGLFLAGDWVGGHGMLAEASFASAEVAAAGALSRLRSPAGAAA